MGLKSLVTGATGLIGRQLLRRLPAARVLSRNVSAAQRTLASAALGGVEVMAWDGRSELATQVFDGIDAVFHLAGEPVAAPRWSAEKRRAIVDSRVLSTRALVRSMAALGQPPAVLVCASAVGFYGDRGDEPLAEDAGPGTGFLAEVCRAWEAEAMAAQATGTRVVCVRTGIVLSRSGGALGAMLPAFRLGLGGRLGDGRQWMPWVHEDDEIGLLMHAAEHASCTGAMNACAPQPVRQLEFARTLAKHLHRPSCVHTPAFVLRGLMGEAADIVLHSQKATPQAALATGYRFAFADLDAAVGALLSAP